MRWLLFSLLFASISHEHFKVSSDTRDRRAEFRQNQRVQTQTGLFGFPLKSCSFVRYPNRWLSILPCLLYQRENKPETRPSRLLFVISFINERRNAREQCVWREVSLSRTPSWGCVWRNNAILRDPAYVRSRANLWNGIPASFFREVLVYKTRFHIQHGGGSGFIWTYFEAKATTKTPLMYHLCFFKRILLRLVGFGGREKICSACKTLK